MFPNLISAAQIKKTKAFYDKARKCVACGKDWALNSKLMDDFQRGHALQRTRCRNSCVSGFLYTLVGTKYVHKVTSTS